MNADVQCILPVELELSALLPAPGLGPARLFGRFYPRYSCGLRPLRPSLVRLQAPGLGPARLSGRLGRQVPVPSVFKVRERQRRRTRGPGHLARLGRESQDLGSLASASRGPEDAPGGLRRRPRAGATAGPWRRSRCRPRGASPGGGSVTAEPRRGSEAPLTSTFIFEGPQRRTGQPDVPGPLAGPVPSAQPRHGHGPIATVLRRTVCKFGCASETLLPGYSSGASSLHSPVYSNHIKLVPLSPHSGFISDDELD